MGTAVTCLPHVVIPSQFPLQGGPSLPLTYLCLGSLALCTHRPAASPVLSLPQPLSPTWVSHAPTIWSHA